MIFPGKLPYHAQIASRELAQKIFSEEMDPKNDPHWQSTGAENVEEYDYWVMRACGIACLKMCVEAFGGTERTLIDWARKGVEVGAYLVIERDGEQIERGWIHAKLAEMMQQEGLSAKALPLEIQDFPVYLANGFLLIASVSYQLGTTEPVTQKGGHLVVVRGVGMEGDKIKEIYINNPSGRTFALQENAAIPVERFASCFTGRVVAVRDR